MLTLIIIPQIRDIAFKKNLFDKPDRRKVHNGTVPRLGGFAFFPVLLITFCTIMGFELAVSNSWISADLIEYLPQVFVLFSAMAALYIGGFCDDLVGIRYIAKFFIQAFCGLITVLSGVFIIDFDTLFGLGEITPILAYFLSFFLIIYIINSINLIDGIDGLASGISIITLLIYGYYFFITSALVYALMSFVMAASIFVFFCFNVFGKEEKRKKIFMGDIGSLSIGMFISFMTLEIAGTPVPEQPATNIPPMIIAFSPIVIPLFDVVRVFFYRLFQSKSPFLPDKNHIHHNLLTIGFSSHATLYSLILFQIVLIVLNLIFSQWLNINIILGIDVAIYILGTILIYRRQKRYAILPVGKQNK